MAIVPRLWSLCLRDCHAGGIWAASPWQTRFERRRRLSAATAALQRKGIFGAGDENTGAAGLAPDALVARSRRTVVVVARDELALVDPQLAVEEMQLFHARMSMRGVTRAGREAHQHADPVPFRVGREQLAFDSGRDLFPFRLGPLLAPAAAPAAFPVSSAIRSARRSCSDVVGRSTSVGQETNRSTTGRRLSSSRWQSGHEAIWASAAATSLAGSACSGVGAGYLALLAAVRYGTYSWLPRFRGQARAAACAVPNECAS